jgi:hypothetical protein
LAIRLIVLAKTWGVPSLPILSRMQAFIKLYAHDASFAINLPLKVFVDF